MPLHSLAPDDARSFEVAVAGPAGLLVAKLHKIAERETTPDRWAPKDGLDVLRILRGVDLAQIATTLAELEVDSVAGLSRERRARTLRCSSRTATRTGLGWLCERAQASKTRR